MKGTTQFRRKDQEMFLDKFRVVAVTTLKPSHFEHFSKHLLDDYSFIERHAKNLCVREDGYSDSLLVLDDEGDDGILVNSEGSYYPKYSSFLPYAKPLFKKQIKDIVDEIVAGRFGDFDSGSWVIGFDDIKEHFDMTVTKENGIGEMIIEELKSRDEISEVIATEDCIEISEYLSEASENTPPSEKLMTVFSLMGCNLEDIHLVDNDEEHELATIVELNQDTLTEQGKKDWADVLSAKVVRIFEGIRGVQISITGCDVERVKDFSYMLSGHCKEEDYRKWVSGGENIDKDIENKTTLSEQEIRLRCAKHLLWLNDEIGGEQADFRNCYLKKTNLSDSDLRSALFDGAVIENCNFYSANLGSVEMRGATVIDTPFSYVNMDNAIVKESEFTRCNLSYVIAHTANFADAKLIKCDLFNANFYNSCFDGTSFEKTNVDDSNIDLSDVESEETWAIYNGAMIM